MVVVPVDFAAVRVVGRTRQHGLRLLGNEGGQNDSDNLAKYFPGANTPGAQFTNQNNFAASGANKTDVDNFDVRIGHNLTQRQRTFGRYSQRTTNEDPAEMFPDMTRGIPLVRRLRPSKFMECPLYIASSKRFL